MTYRGIHFIRRIRKGLGAAFRGRFKVVVGYIRYFNAKPNIYDPRDHEILQSLIYACGLPLNTYTLNRLLNRTPTLIQFSDGTLYAIMDLEDFYHASMCYEPQTLTFIQRHLASGGVFVDVGANIGGYTVRVAKRAYVYAFEPEPRNFNLLRLNIKLNKLQNNVKSFQVAAGPYLGKVKLALSNYHGRHSLLRTIKTTNYPTIDVDMTPLDLILANEDRIDIIKIDVEGAEPLVLKGAREVLKRTKAVVIEAVYPTSFHQASYILSKYSFKPARKLDFNIVFVKK
jgi:FkbM family methyltransferase